MYTYALRQALNAGATVVLAVYNGVFTVATRACACLLFNNRRHGERKIEKSAIRDGENILKKAATITWGDGAKRKYY